MACTVCGGSHAPAPDPARAAIPSKQTEGGKCEPCPFLPSCETQNALAQCVKQAFCDVLRCAADALKDSLAKSTNANPVTTCLQTAVISFADCVPDALCGPKVVPPKVSDDLPCDFAVEETLSLNKGRRSVLSK